MQIDACCLRRRPAARSLDRGAAIDYFLPKEARHGEDRYSRRERQGGAHASSVRPRKKRKRMPSARRRKATTTAVAAGGAVRPPARKAGGNRYSWDLRYPGATTFEGLIFWGAHADQGPLAVPGQYQVRLTAERRHRDAAADGRARSARNQHHPSGSRGAVQTGERRCATKPAKRTRW